MDTIVTVDAIVSIDAVVSKVSKAAKESIASRSKHSPYRFIVLIISLATTCPEMRDGGIPGPGVVNCPV